MPPPSARQFGSTPHGRLSDDALSLFTAALIAEAGITLDQTAINAVNAQMNN